MSTAITKDLEVRCLQAVYALRHDRMHNGIFHPNNFTLRPIIRAVIKEVFAAQSESAPPAPGEVRLTSDEAAWVRTWLEPLDQWSSPMAKQIAAKMDAAAAPEHAR